METRKNLNTTKVPRMTEVFPQAYISDKIILFQVQPAFNQQ